MLSPLRGTEGLQQKDYTCIERTFQVPPFLQQKGSFFFQQTQYIRSRIISLCRAGIPFILPFDFEFDAYSFLS